MNIQRLQSLIVVATLLVVSTLAAGLTSVVSNVPSGSFPVGPVAAQVMGWSVAIVSVFVLFLLIYRIVIRGTGSAGRTPKS